MLKSFRNLISAASPACGLDYDKLKIIMRQLRLARIHSKAPYSRAHPRHGRFDCGNPRFVSCWAEPWWDRCRDEKIGGGEAGCCLLRGCSDRPLVFFQRVWVCGCVGVCVCVCACVCMRVSQKTCSQFSWDYAGVIDWKHVCLCTIVV